MRSAPLLALLAGCSAVYNADYDDRQNTLAQATSVALPATDRVQFVTTGEDRLFWTDEEQAVETTAFHSLDTASGKRVDYGFTSDLSELPADVALGDDFVVECAEASAFAAGSSSTTAVAQLPDNEDVEFDSHCALIGSDVYLIAGTSIVKWRPEPGGGSQTTTTVIDLMALQVKTGSILGLAAVDSTHFVYGEGNNLWLLTAGGATGSASLLNSETNLLTSGIVAVNSEGVVYPVANSTPMYATFADPMNPTLISDMISNGGYDLLGNSSVQQLGPNAFYTIAGTHLVYQGQGGIFALGLDTGNVTDILLDGRLDSDEESQPPQYQLPAVTTKNLMFVQNVTDFDADPTNQTVYSVDITDRLK